MLAVVLLLLGLSVLLLPDLGAQAQGSQLGLLLRGQLGQSPSLAFRKAGRGGAGTSLGEAGVEGIGLCRDTRVQVSLRFTLQHTHMQIEALLL